MDEIFMDKFMIGLLTLLVSLIIFNIFATIHSVNERDLACQELGFESYEYINDMNYCEDKESNLHYIKIDCKPWYWISCTAKPISVGDVRVR